MAGTDVTPIVVALGDLAVALGPDGLKPVLTAIGMTGKDESTRAVRSDIGDVSMSNWRRAKPISIGARFDLSGTSVMITPDRRSRGPWKVLESGRRAGTSRRGRRYSSSSGKGTWSDAERLIEVEAPRVAQRALEVEAQRRWMR